MPDTGNEHLRAEYLALLPHASNLYRRLIFLLDDKKTVIKTGQPWRLVLEAEAMRFAAKHTSIPLPAVYDVWNDGEKAYLAMEFKQGRSPRLIWSTLSQDQKRYVLRTLKGYIDQLRSIPQPSDFYGTICSPLGNGDISDFAVDPYDPFPSCSSETIFNNRRIDKYVEPWKSGDDTIIRRQLNEARSGLSENRSVKFTHSDLAIWNIHVNVTGPLVADVQIAILDWEQAGWRPEYWENFKFKCGAVHKEWWEMSIEEGVIDINYSSELDVEFKIRRLRGPL